MKVRVRGLDGKVAEYRLHTAGEPEPLEDPCLYAMKVLPEGTRLAYSRHYEVLREVVATQGEF